MASEPPPIKPFIYKPVSTSTLVTGQQQIPVSPPPLHDTPSSPPRLKPQIIAQKSNRNTDTTFPESRGGSAGLYEGENVRPHGISQGSTQYPPPVAGSYGSRRLTVHELFFAIADTSVRLDFIRDLGDNDEGKYWSGTRPSSSRASRVFVSKLSHPSSDINGGSALNVSDRRHQGGQSRNPSRALLCLITFWRLISSRTGMHLSNNPSRDYLAQDQSGVSVFPPPLTIE